MKGSVRPAKNVLEVYDGMYQPAEKDMGPCMKACTPLERMLIVALVEIGAKNYTDAAMMTGHFSNRQSAQSWSSMALGRERVRLALKEWTQTALEGDVYLARKALREIVSDPLHKDRFKAVQELFNRNGMLIETVSRHIIEDTRDTAEVIAQAVRYAKTLGDRSVAYKLLDGIATRDVIDAEFTEIPAKELAPAIAIAPPDEDGSDGLEDLLA